VQVDRYRLLSIALGEHSAPRCSAQASALARYDPNLFAGPTSSTDSTANRLSLAGGATRGLCCGHLGRSSGASQRLGRASFMWPQQVH